MRKLFSTLVLVCLAGCTKSVGEIEFCGIENGHFEREPTRFNIAEQRILGSDVSHEFSVVDSEIARGFVSPFPLTLPKTSSGNPEQWELGGYTFTTSKPPSEDPDWVLIYGRPSNQNSEPAAQHSSVLYSSTRGVLAIRLLSDYQQESLATELFSCGTGQLHASTFERAQVNR